MRSVVDVGFDPARGRYLPRTMRTAVRDPIPQKSDFPDWALQGPNQTAPLWGLFTPSKLNFYTVSASFQGAIRQGRVLEALQWTLEMIRADANLHDSHLEHGASRKVGKGESNFWTRAFIISAEDIALANPRVIVTMAEIARNPPVFSTQAEAEHYMMRITLMLTQSMKSRAADWAALCRIPTPEDAMPFDNLVMYTKLLECLVSGNHVLAAGYAESFIGQSLKDKKDKTSNTLPRTLFAQLAAGVTYRGKPVKHFTNRRQLIWVAFLKCLQLISVNGKQWPTITAIVEACYELSHDDKFRWKVPGRLFGRTAILAICFRDEMENRGLSAKNGPVKDMPLRREYSPEELEQIRLGHLNGNLWYGLSDVCKDKHTKEGSQLGRENQHFVEVKAFLRHEDMTLAALSDFYLKLCFQTRYAYESVQNGIFEKSGQSIEQYSQWLPELRRQHDTLNHIEDLLYQQTMTITFCEAAESFIHMEQLGKIAPEGFTCAELTSIGNNFRASGFEVEYYDLRQLLTAVKGQDGTLSDRSGEAEEAGILILRNIAGRFVDPVQTGDALFDSLPQADMLMLDLLKLDWDKKAFMKGRVVNKKARHNLVFADFERGPNYEKKQGRIIDFKNVPRLNSVRAKLGLCFGDKAKNLLAEGNHYYDADSCYIGWHSDLERNIVIGLRMGASMNLGFRWYLNSTAVGQEGQFVLNHGDLYLLSHKAVASDGRKKKIFVLRHAANTCNIK